MKLVYLFHQGAELYGSDKIFFYSVECLARTHKVKVFLDSDGPLKAAIEGLGCHVEVMNLAVVRRSKLKGKKIISFIVEFVRSLFVLAWRMAFCKPDIVYVNTLAVVSPLFVARFFHIPIVHHLHETIIQPRYVTKILYSLSSFLSFRTICVSCAVYKNLVRSSFCQVSAVVIHNGISPIPLVGDVECFLSKYSLSRCVKIIAMIGRISHGKGQDVLVRAIHYLVNMRNCKDIIVVIMGDVYPGYEYVAEDLRSLIGLYGLEQNFVFTGFDPNTAYLYNLADVVVVPSTQPDSFPTVILEAMSVGRVVIATACGGSVEMLDDLVNGFLIPPSDPFLLSEKIYEVLYIVNQQAVGNSARMKFIRNFSVDAYANKINNFFLNIR